MFDHLHETISRPRAQDWFGGGARPAAAPEASPISPSPAPTPGVTGRAAPGVYSPAAETVLDGPERPYTGLSAEEEYRQRRAAMDARDAGSGFFQRAMARLRGEPVDEPAIAPERGAPTREARDPLEIIDETLANLRRPAPPRETTPPPEPERPYTGFTPEEDHRAHRAASDERTQSPEYEPYRRALARHRGEPAEEMPIHPEPAAPARPPRGILEIIDETLANLRRPTPPREATPPPGPERPYTGLTPEEEYRARSAASAARTQSPEYEPYRRALAARRR